MSLLCQAVTRCPAVLGSPPARLPAWGLTCSSSRASIASLQVMK